MLLKQKDEKLNYRLLNFIPSHRDARDFISA